jgi:site-specific DNA-adenine methylase
MILRFRGSKAQLLPMLRPYIDRLVDGCDSYHEPFVGSGTVLLDTAHRHACLKLSGNDADAALIVFWRTVSGSSVDSLCDRILDTKPTVELFPLFLDPPYFGRGNQLYPQKMTFAQHLELSRLLRNARSWVLTLDDNPTIRQLYSWACFHIVPDPLSARYGPAPTRQCAGTGDYASLGRALARWIVGRGQHGLGLNGHVAVLALRVCLVTI